MLNCRCLARIIALGCCLQTFVGVNASEQVDFKNVDIQSTATVVLPDRKAIINDHEYCNFTEFAKSLTTCFPTYGDVQRWNEAVMTDQIQFDKELKAPHTEATIPYEWGGSSRYKNFKEFWYCNM